MEETKEGNSEIQMIQRKKWVGISSQAGGREVKTEGERIISFYIYLKLCTTHSSICACIWIYIQCSPHKQNPSTEHENPPFELLVRVV